MRTLLALCVILSLVPACFRASKREEALRRDVDRLERRVSARERDLAAEVAALDRAIEAARAALGRNAAGLGADLQAFQADLRAARGQISSLQAAVERDRADRAARLDRIEARLVALEQQATQPRTAAELWDTGRAAFNAGRWGEARALFQRLIEEFPGHDRADDARYFRGEAFLREESWEAAIREYRAVFDRHPESSLADDALFRAAHAAEKLRQCSEARTYLGLLRQRYERSELARQALVKDRALRASSRSKAACRS